jgi:hypothetical protein
LSATIEQNESEVPMSGVAKKKLKTFHATMQVTRLEQWWVEAETPAEAKALLVTGTGHRCAPGECLHAELQDFGED